MTLLMLPLWYFNLLHSERINESDMDYGKHASGTDRPGTKQISIFPSKELLKIADLYFSSILNCSIHIQMLKLNPSGILEGPEEEGLPTIEEDSGGNTLWISQILLKSP